MIVFVKSESIETVQRLFRTNCRLLSPTNKTLYVFRKFEENGCLVDRKQAGCPSLLAETTCISTKHEKVSLSSWCGITDSGKSVWHIVQRNLQIKLYRLQLMQHLSPNPMCLCVHAPSALWLARFTPKDRNHIRYHLYDMLKWARENFDFRLNICCITKGSHIKYFLNKNL